MLRAPSHFRIRLALQFFAGYHPAQGSELVSQAQNP